MIHYAKRGQVSYGEAIGIIMLDTFTPFIPGDVGNASTYSFPVKYRTVKGLSVKYLLSKEVKCDMLVPGPLLEAGKELVKEGVKAITGDCGYMVIYQKEMANKLEVPVFLSSLLQVPFISSIIGKGNKVGIMCANSETLDTDLLQKVGVQDPDSVWIKGLQTKYHFNQAIIEETGILDSKKIESEMVSAAEEMISEAPSVKAILFECSVMPPYGAAVQRAVDLPVFDYITMINYVYSTIVKKRFEGFM